MDSWERVKMCSEDCHQILKRDLTPLYRVENRETSS